MEAVSKPTILVVDDFPTNLMLAEFALKAKYNVLTAKSGKEALDILSTNQIDAVLLDVNMPEMDGFETYDKLRELDAYRNTPVCFLTGDTDENCLEKIKELMAPLIEKPFNPVTINKVLEDLI